MSKCNSNTEATVSGRNKKRIRKVDNILFFVTPEHKSGATKNTQIIDRYYRTSNLTLTSPPPKAAASPSGLSICPKRV